MSKAFAVPRSVVITGASTGIGCECVRRMTERGWKVYACVRRESDLDQFESDDGKQPIAVLMDVTKPEQIVALSSRLTGELGENGLDGLVNNAGVAITGPLEVIPVASWREVFEVNVLGPVAVTQALLPLLREAKGRIVNMSSIAGKVAPRYLGPYAASKHALEALSDALRREIISDGVRVSIVEPGVVDTPIWEKGLTHLRALYQSLSPSLQSRYAAAFSALDTGTTPARSGGMSPTAVAAIVEHALTAKRPLIRYPVDNRTRWKILLSRVLPDVMTDMLLRR